MSWQKRERINDRSNRDYPFLKSRKKKEWKKKETTSHTCGIPSSVPTYTKWESWKEKRMRKGLKHHKFERYQSICSRSSRKILVKQIQHKNMINWDLFTPVVQIQGWLNITVSKHRVLFVCLFVCFGHAMQLMGS